MNLSEVANFAEALAVICAVIFGVAQFRNFQVERRRDATFALMNSLMIKDILRALSVIDALPDGLSKAEIEQQTGDNYWDTQLLLIARESRTAPVPVYAQKKYQG